jgi:hypothetical protein
MFAISQNQLLIIGPGVTDPQPEHEPIHLRFRQRIRSVMLDWVLRGQHDKGRRQRVGHALHRYLTFRHGFKQRGLRLRRRTIDLVGKDDIGEYGARFPLEDAGALIVN